MYLKFVIHIHTNHANKTFAQISDLKKWMEKTWEVWRTGMDRTDFHMTSEYIILSTENILVTWGILQMY
jgi:hypothetical protein